MSSRRFQDVFSVTIFRLPGRLEDVLKMSSRRLARGLENLFKTSSRRLGRRKIVMLKKCSRRLQDVLKTSKCLLGFFFAFIPNDGGILDICLVQDNFYWEHIIIFQTSLPMFVWLVSNRFNSCFQRSPGQKPMRLAPMNTRISWKKNSLPWSSRSSNRRYSVKEGLRPYLIKAPVLRNF